MNKALLVIALLLLSIGIANAQMYLGLRAGYNLANVKFSPDDLDTSNRTGFHAGGFLLWQFPLGIMLQPELLYSQNGFQLDATGPDEHFNIDYLNMPVLVKYNLDLKAISIQPYIGPEFGFAVTAERTFDDITNDIMDEINALNFSVDMGADIILMRDYLIGLRYQMGVSDIFKTAPVPEAGGETETNSSWMISLGIVF